jgi:eukaryotic-like serine/threonine-protein kinase
VTSGAPVDDAGQSAAGPERSLDLAGSIVKGRYRVNAIASVSRDVVVYTAEDIRYRRPIALKVLRDEFAADPAFVNAVRDQASILALLSHAHRGVARVYECDAMDDGRLFVAVERTKGATLREVLDARGPLFPSTALRIASRVGEALEALHHSKIIHGELGPDSVLIVPDAYGTEHVTLVGVELTAAHRTPIGLRLHEAAPYRAPEQIERGETAEAADVYALGMLLRELLTAVWAPGTTGAPPTLPPATERIITTALEARPEDRYPDLSVMVNDIWGAQAALAEPELRVRPVKPRSPVAIRSRPSGFPVTLRIAGAIVATGVIAVIVWLASDRIVSHFRARVTAPALSVAPVERSLISPPAQPLPTEPASVPSSAANAAPDGTSTRSESQPVKDPSPVEERAPVVVTPAPAPQPVKDASPVEERAPAVVKPAPPPVAVRPERPRAPAAAPVVVDRPRSPVESRAPAERPATANRPVTDARDGSAIIDWLLENRR